MPLRWAVRQRVAARVRQRTRDVWPIFPGSERAPDGWKGWPEGRRLAVVLTHDVERQEGVENCRQLMELESEMGFRSTFNFVPQGTYRTPPSLRDELVSRGFEVGVHDLEHDGRLFQSRKDFSRKAAQINIYLRDWNATGFRSGFMLHNLNWLHDLDISYDMSTFDTDPFEPQPDGYHTIFPFWVDRVAAPNGAKPGYVELPYTIPQDSTLFLLLREQTAEVWLRKVDWIAKHGGMVLVNIHPDYIDFDGSNRKGRRYPAALLREFLSYLRDAYKGEYWNPTAGELAVWYKNWYSSLPIEKAHAPRSLAGKRSAIILFSHYPADPRPRRAAEALAAEGMVTDLICLQGNPFELRREAVNGINVTRIPLKRRRSGKVRYIWQYLVFTAISFGYLAFRSIRRRYDLVHVHNMPDFLVFSALVPKMLGAKVVLDLHDPMPELMQTIFELPADSLAVLGLKIVEKCSTAFADVVLTVNKACKRIYSSRSCPAKKITIVVNSPDDSMFKPSLASVPRKNVGHEFVVLYHGSLVHRNGFDLAVQAIEAVRKTIPRPVLVACGARTPFLDMVMEFVRDRRLEESVRYLGPQSLPQIVEVIERCDLGIVPNHRNLFTEINTPTRIFEYLALGRPVIAPRAGGILDYFGENDLIYFNPGDHQDLAEKIEYVYNNPDRIEEVVRAGQKVYQSHAWTVEKARLIDTVSNLLTNRSP